LSLRITGSSALSPTVCSEFPSTTTLSSKIGSTISSRPNRRISSSVGSKTCPNVGSVVNNGGEYIIDWLFDYLCEK
jgi:hypothetical protein